MIDFKPRGDISRAPAFDFLGNLLINFLVRSHSALNIGIFELFQIIGLMQYYAFYIMYHGGHDGLNNSCH